MARARDELELAAHQSLLIVELSNACTPPGLATTVLWCDLAPRRRSTTRSRRPVGVGFWSPSTRRARDGVVLDLAHRVIHADDPDRRCAPSTSLPLAMSIDISPERDPAHASCRPRGCRITSTIDECVAIPSRDAGDRAVLDHAHRPSHRVGDAARRCTERPGRRRDRAVVDHHARVEGADRRRARSRARARGRASRAGRARCRRRTRRR